MYCNRCGERETGDAGGLCPLCRYSWRTLARGSEAELIAELAKSTAAGRTLVVRRIGRAGDTVTAIFALLPP